MKESAVSDSLSEELEPVLQERYSVDQNPSTHQEHRCRPDKGQELHKPGCVPHDEISQAADPASLTVLEAKSYVVGLHDESHGSVDTQGHSQPDHGQGESFRDQSSLGHGSKSHSQNLGGEDGVGTDGTAYLLLLQGYRVDRFLSVLRNGLLLVKNLVECFVAQESAAEQQDRSDKSGRQQESQRDEQSFVSQ